MGIDEFDQSGRDVSNAGDINGDGIDDLNHQRPCGRPPKPELCGFWSDDELSGVISAEQACFRLDDFSRAGPGRGSTHQDARAPVARVRRCDRTRRSFHPRWNLRRGRRDGRR
jgi:hypothetical protein